MLQRRLLTESSAINIPLRRLVLSVKRPNIILTVVKGRPRLKKAIADAYSPFFGKTINPETEVTITTGANEGMLSAFMGFLEQGDEVIIFEPFFDQYEA